MFKAFFCIVVTGWLVACSSLVPVRGLPQQQNVDSRLFKIERFDEHKRLYQSSLLAIQFELQQWRWIQTDPLGAPIARLILTKSGWKNDGFVMPNNQAKQLFSALATALNQNHPLFEFSAIDTVDNAKVYRINNKVVWKITQDPPHYLITLSDQSYWRIEELNQ